MYSLSQSYCTIDTKNALLQQQQQKHTFIAIGKFLLLLMAHMFG